MLEIGNISFFTHGTLIFTYSSNCGYAEVQYNLIDISYSFAMFLK